MDPTQKIDPETLKSLRQRRIDQTSAKYRVIMARAIAGTASPRQAIKAFCLHCVGDLRDQVRDCTAYACPLWQYRPYQQGDEDSEKDG